MSLRLEPIPLIGDPNNEIFSSPESREVLKSYSEYYQKNGYHFPWTGYFVLRDEKIVGCCGFVNKPEKGG